MEHHEQIAEDWQTFERTWTRGIVASINKVRGAEGVTVAALARRLNAGGWKVSQATVAGILSGNKRTSISVAELSAFAWALDVAPLYLLMGLPDLEALPDAKLWDGLPANPPRVYEWFVRASEFGYRYSHDARPDDGVGAGRMAAETSGALLLVSAHARNMRIISWQAAQIIALDEFGDPKLTAAAPRAVSERLQLRISVDDLADIRREQRELQDRNGDDWSVNMGVLPDVLKFIDRGEEQTEFTLGQLRQMTTPERIERARENFKKLRNELDSGGDNASS